MQISDKTLMIVGLITFLITLGSITVILVELGGVGGLAGLVTSTNTSFGYVNVTIESNVAVTLVTNTIDFGDGFVSTTGDPINTSDGDNEGANPGGFNNPGPFRLRNDGNTNVNVTLNGSTPQELLGIATIVNYSFATKNISTNELFNNTCRNADSGAGINFYHYANSSSTQPFGITMSNAHQMVCPNMSYITGYDEFNVSIFFNLSNSITPNTTRSDVVQFLITSLGHS